MSKEFWIDKWSEGITPWDIGQAHPMLAPALEAVRNELPTQSQCTVIVPGCGSGHDLISLQEAGYENILAIDIAPHAIAKASQLYGHLKSIHFACVNFLDDDVGIEPSDLLIDHAMLCALPIKLRAPYLSSCARALKPGGIFLSICFDEVSDTVKGPPFSVPVVEARELLASDFIEVSARLHEAAVRRPIIKRESILIFKRREAGI